MSHHKERKEKNCLNCNAALKGRYCHICGQENIEPKENFWHLVNHFVEDITHFDGKFFTTLKDLLFKPGFLTAEYLRGRRASYLHPIRMYVFTSAVFFLISFSVAHLDDKVFQMDEDAKEPSKISMGYNTDKDKSLDSAMALLDSVKAHSKKGVVVVSGDTLKFNSVKEYDSVQTLLSTNKRDGWFKRTITKREIGLKQNLIPFNQSVYKKIMNELVHSVPKMMFILLPLFALALQLLYVRNKKLLYIDHAIFIIHLFVAIYMLWIISFGFSYLKGLTGWGFLSSMPGIMFLVIQFYQYKAMRNFYKQGRLKTFLKYCLFNFISLIIFLIVGIIFFLNTASVQIN